MKCKNCPYELYRIVKIQVWSPSVCEVCVFRNKEDSEEGDKHE